MSTIENHMQIEINQLYDEARSIMDEAKEAPEPLHSFLRRQALDLQIQAAGKKIELIELNISQTAIR